VTAKPAEDGVGVVFRVRDLGGAQRTVDLRFDAATPASAASTSPVEEDGDALPIDGTTVSVPLGTRGLTSVRVRFQGS
jgi:alpha-mannosidase